MGEQLRHHVAGPADRGTAGDPRLEAAARARHLVAAQIPIQRAAPTLLPRQR
jgi:hypothetical protein